MPLDEIPKVVAFTCTQPSMSYGIMSIKVYLSNGMSSKLFMPRGHLYYEDPEPIQLGDTTQIRRVQVITDENYENPRSLSFIKEDGTVLLDIPKGYGKTGNVNEDILQADE